MVRQLSTSVFLCAYSYLASRYTEAIVMFKLPQDAPWHASALEGLATISVLEAWLTGHGLVGYFQTYLKSLLKLLS